MPRFFSTHQAAVVGDATARIAPGPEDDPARAGQPGAREAGVTAYIDAMLAAVEAADWQRQYTRGIAMLDELAGGDFTGAAPAGQDEILARPEVRTFLSLLFEHTIEGMYGGAATAGSGAART